MSIRTILSAIDKQLAILQQVRALLSEESASLPKPRVPRSKTDSQLPFEFIPSQANVAQGAPRRRGRPAGSRNKPKTAPAVHVVMEPVLVETAMEYQEEVSLPVVEKLRAKVYRPRVRTRLVKATLSHDDAKALTSVIPMKPVVVMPKMLEQEQEIRKQQREAREAAITVAPPAPSGGLDSLIQELAHRRIGLPQ